MIKIQIVCQDGAVVRVLANGHAGYAESGSDIVCAAVSAVMETALLGLKKVAGVTVDSVRDEKKGFLEFWLKTDAAEKRDCQVILQTMLAGITDLTESWSRYIKTEVIQL